MPPRRKAALAVLQDPSDSELDAPLAYKSQSKNNIDSDSDSTVLPTPVPTTLTRRLVRITAILQSHHLSQLLQLLTCLSKLSPVVDLDARKDVFWISTVSPSRTVYASCRLATASEQCFKQYKSVMEEVPRSHLNDMEASFPRDRIYARLVTKTLIAALKRQSGETTFTMDTRTSRLSLQSMKEGYKNQIHLFYELIEPLHLAEDPTIALHQWTLAPKLMQQLVLRHFNGKDILMQIKENTNEGEDEDWVVEPFHVLFSSASSETGATPWTTVKVASHAFDALNSAGPSEAIAFQSRTVRALVALALSFHASLSCAYTKPSHPMKWRVQYGAAVGTYSCAWQVQMTTATGGPTSINMDTNENENTENTDPNQKNAEWQHVADEQELESEDSDYIPGTPPISHSHVGVSIALDS